LVHAVHALNALTWQCTAHGPALHARVSSMCAHAAPAKRAARATLRERDCEPVPHDSVHVVQELNTLSSQSIGHSCVWHVRTSCAYGHALPPKVGCVCTRVRAW
jgi:hypothetical protein